MGWVGWVRGWVGGWGEVVAWGGVRWVRGWVGLGGWVGGRGKPYFASDDLFVNLVRVVVEEGRVANNHFVDEDAERPVVHSLAVPGDITSLTV